MNTILWAGDFDEVYTLWNNASLHGDEIVMEITEHLLLTIFDYINLLSCLCILLTLYPWVIIALTLIVVTTMSISIRILNWTLLCAHIKYRYLGRKGENRRKAPIYSNKKRE